MRTPVAARPQPATAAAAPAELPVAQVSAAAQSGRPAEGDAARNFLMAMIALGGLLVGAAAIPAPVLPRGEVRHLVDRHRTNLALLGVATVAAVGVAYLVVYATS